MPGTPTCVYPRDRGKGDAKTVHCMGGKIGIPTVSKIFQMGNPSKYFNGYINPYYWVDDHPLLIYVWKWWELISKDLGKFHRDHFSPSSHPKWCVTKGIPPIALSSGCIQSRLRVTLWKSAAQSWHFHFLAQLIGFCKSRYYERLRGKTIYIYITSTEREPDLCIQQTMACFNAHCFSASELCQKQSTPGDCIHQSIKAPPVFISAIPSVSRACDNHVFAAFTVRISHMFWKTYEV